MKKLIASLIFFSLLSPVNHADESSYGSYDDKTVFELTMNDALAGDAKAQYKICNFYYDGQGAEKSYEKAFEWCGKAAKLNYPPAQAFVGGMYAAGEGVREDRTEAHNWYRKAANLGNGTALFNLASRYAAHKKYDISYAIYSLAMIHGEKKLAEAARDVDLSEMNEMQITLGNVLARKLERSKNFLETLDEYEALHYQK